MALYLLHRSQNGYSLYEANGLDYIGHTAEAVRNSLSDPDLFGRVVKLVARRPFWSLIDTFVQVNAVTKGVFTQALRDFLRLNLPRDKSGYRLGAILKLQSLILKSTQIQCVSDEGDELVLVLLSGIRLFESLLCPQPNIYQCPIPYNLLLTRILPRLPIKTLLRFRLACNNWESIICDPEFGASLKSHHRLLYTVANSKGYNLSFYTTKEAGDNFLLEEPWGKLDLECNWPFECNDYLLLTKYRIIPDPNPIPNRFIPKPVFPADFALYPAVRHAHGLILVGDHYYGIIYNPSTRESLELPDVRVVTDEGPLNYGKKFLLYEHSTKEYKCLNLHEDAGQKGWLEAHVIAVGDSAWKKLTLPADGIRWVDYPYNTQAYLKGWLYVVDRRRVMRFNPLSEILEEVCDVPDLMVSLPYYLFVYEGKLAITSLFMGLDDDDEDDPPCLHTLDNDGWTRMDFVLDEETAEILKLCEKRGITANGELVLTPLEFTYHNVIHYFNPRDGSLKTSQAEFKGMIEMDYDGVHPRALVDMDHVDNHLIFLAKE